jgi:RimJ/RimL family protein N-acetyltransferase
MSPSVATYNIAFPELAIQQIHYQWLSEIDTACEEQIIGLMRETTANAPIIGFSTVIADAEAISYIRELRENLAAGKCRLLKITSDGGQLVGLCTLRRNLNPNNRHIADLAKGMIAERCRGGPILSAAFHEISLQCERDGIELVTLDVRANTPAHQTWSKFGFVTWGVLDDYARVNGERLAGHYMMQAVADLKARVAKVLALKQSAPGVPNTDPQ